MTVTIMKIANAKAALVPNRKDVPHILTDVDAVANDMPHMHPP